MEVTPHVIIDVRVLHTRHVEVCRTTVLVDPDGNEVARRPWRRAYEPGADISEEADWVQAVAAAAWTPDKVAEYRAWRDAHEAQTLAQLAAAPPQVPRETGPVRT